MRLPALLPRSFPGGVLRRFRASDLAPFQAYRNDPEIGRYQDWSRKSDEEARAFIAEVQSAPLFTPGKWVQLAIADSTGEQLIGDIGIQLAETRVVALIGFTLAPAAQGRGIASAAVKEATAMTFAATGVPRIMGITDARNDRSIRLLERLGFVRVDQRAAEFRGEPCVEYIYVLTPGSVAGRAATV